MLPIILRSEVARIGVAGAGEGLQRRLALLQGADVSPVLFEDRLPIDDEWAGLTVLFVAGFDDQRSTEAATQARARRVLVNVEDVPDLCDFHVPALVRRGDLLLTVSTGGRAPGLARAVRSNLERRFGPEWNARLDEVARLRKNWRGEGLPPQDVSRQTQAYLDAQGWLA